MSDNSEKGSATNPQTNDYDASQVGMDDLSAFYQAHFGDSAINQFGHTFLNPAVGASVEQEEQQWEEEDDLGYYDDGVKRTLTDDQIAMFRHTELKEWRRKEEKAALKKHKHSHDDSDEIRQDSEGAPDEESSLPSQFTSTKKRKKTHPPKEPKPDLRKRTWDVVKTSVDTLDYD